MISYFCGIQQLEIQIIRTLPTSLVPVVLQLQMISQV